MLWKPERYEQLKSVAELQHSPGQPFRLYVTPGCEVFVGRFMQIDALRTGDGTIRFHHVAKADLPN